MRHIPVRSVLSFIALSLMTLVSLSAVSADDKKLKPEELLAHHLDSIGSKESLEALKTRAATGAVKVSRRVGTAGEIVGKGVFLSASPKLIYSMKFPSIQYPSEQMAFDGTRTATGFLPEGKRSNLSLFLDQQSLPLKEGLLGGALSTSWALLRVTSLQPKLEYKGVKKIDEKSLHVLIYRQRSGSPDLKVTLYFDETTFRHLRSEYKFVIPARIGYGNENSNQIQESYYLLTEEFDEFRAVDGLTLPHRYKLQLSVSTSQGTLLMDWLMNVESITHKEVVDEKSFRLQ